MKKAVLIIGAIALAAGAFLGGMAAGKLSPANKTAKDSPAVSNDEPYSSEDNKQAESEKTAVNVFFSPHTGSDETGDGSQQNPFASEEKAREHAKTLELNENEEAVILEFLMSVEVHTQAGYGVSSEEGTINMIPFTGSSDGYYFKGEIVGTGCDTQKFGVEGCPAFSARYLLKGTDYRGKECSIFIENNGDSLDKCTPTIITDSLGLSKWQTANLRTIVTPVGFGVIVDCYEIH
jgi:hypothetical protein